ncbi:DUF5916 domain-containing protein [Marinicella sp. W31]|uniref:DUF5916 domain-containing protein n=1 Tax=Marinicella sp. W31 TaxID=3023713 RepID=UPI0037570B14
MQRIISLLFLLFFNTMLCASITLDGVLDEPEWADAQSFTELLLVDPYVLSEPEFTTEILVLSNQNGIYFGIKNNQPQSTRNNDITARDRFISSDQNNIIIDFDNNSIAAYAFQVGSGGSIRDGIWSNENQFSAEWDGNWQAKTSSSDSSWITEIHIPWDVVSMKKSLADQRTVRWYFSRNVALRDQTYALFPADTNRQRFLSEFEPLTIADFSSSSLQVFGYATARNDFIDDDLSSDIGMDVFWKSGQGKQLSLTVNPDFGQIESDNLVVNFEPTEVFFNERRPFFTENQSLFDVRGAQSLRVLNTRRIGARPDAGNALASDIDAAIKYSDKRNNVSYGLFAANESSGDGFTGRDFYAGRFIHRTEHQSLGFLGTYTDRPDINRTAAVYSFDHEYLWNDTLRFNNQLVLTDINQDGQNSDDWGGRIRVNHQINANSNQQIELSHYGRDFEIFDFGFLRRNNLNTLSYSNSFRFNDFAEQSNNQRHEIRINADFKRNDDGKNLGAYFRFLDIWSFKDSSFLNWYIEYLSSGKNDLFSRGNGLLNTEPGYTASFTYHGKNSGKFRYHGFLDYTDTFLGGQGIATHIHPSYYFSDNYFITWEFNYTDTKNWLNWQNDDLIGAYERKFFDTILDFNANISQRQELRLRFQWLAIDATADQQFRLNGIGDLDPTEQPLNDFSISNTALQIRYRYELSPLSNIYIAYSRGGGFFREEKTSIGDLFSPGFDEVNSDNFLIKVRYKFY